MKIKKIISKALGSWVIKPLLATLIVFAGLGTSSQVLVADGGCSDNGNHGWNLCDDQCDAQGCGEAIGCSVETPEPGCDESYFCSCDSCNVDVCDIVIED